MVDRSPRTLADAPQVGRDAPQVGRDADAARGDAENAAACAALDKALAALRAAHAHRSAEEVRADFDRYRQELRDDNDDAPGRHECGGESTGGPSAAD